MKVPIDSLSKLLVSPRKIFLNLRSGFYLLDQSPLWCLSYNEYIFLTEPHPYECLVSYCITVPLRFVTVEF